jgi:hypothetical protein
MTAAAGRRLGALCAPMLLGSMLLLSACGGSSSNHPAVAANVASSAHSSPSATATAPAGAPAPRDPVSTGVVVHKPLHGTGGREINDDNPGNADSGNQSAPGTSNPCALVSRAQAQAILHAPVEAPEEAPLGPTCIYQPRGAKSFVTMTIEPTSFAKVERLIRKRSQFSVGGHTAYCGIYGQLTTFVPLSSGRYLDITASCDVGRLFAEEAVSRLKA